VSVDIFATASGGAVAYDMCIFKFKQFTYEHHNPRLGA